jgi:purine nucleosidase
MRRMPMSLYDPTAAAALMAPTGMVFRPAHLVMELQGRHTRDMTALEWRVSRRAPANALVAHQAEEKLLRSVVLDALAARE